jgi:hypothetical protein
MPDGNLFIRMNAGIGQRHTGCNSLATSADENTTHVLIGSEGLQGQGSRSCIWVGHSRHSKGDLNIRRYALRQDTVHIGVSVSIETCLLNTCRGFSLTVAPFDLSMMARSLDTDAGTSCD